MTDTHRGARRPLTDSELEERLAAVEPKGRLRPPTDLLAKIQSEIPEDLGLGTANDGGAAQAAPETAWWQRHRMAIAAAFVVVAATGLLSVRLAKLASPDRLAAVAEDSAGEPLALPAVRSTAPSSDRVGSEEAGAVGEQDRNAAATSPAPAARFAAPEEARLSELQREGDDLGQSEPILRNEVVDEPTGRSGKLEGELDASSAPQDLRQDALERNSKSTADAEQPSAPPAAAKPRQVPRAQEATSRVPERRLRAPSESGAPAGARAATPEPARDEITVTTETPLLDERKVQAGTTISQVELEKTPTARDPWGVLEETPGVLESQAAAGEAIAKKEVADSSLARLGAVPTDVTRPPRAAAAPSADLDASFDAMQFRPAPTNPFEDPAEDPLSTFGLDVDTGSYTLARRYLDLDRLPPSESVRVEEYVNFFDYGDPAPRRGDFALRLEAGPSAFAPDGAERLMLRVGVRARDVAEHDRKPAALVFLVDVSGSMQRENRLELVKRSLELLIDELGPEDSIGLVVYGSTGRALLEPTRDHDAIRQAIARLVPEGSTNLQDGLGIAYEMASRIRPRASSRELIRRVILCSDGVANVGVTDAEALLRGVADWAVQGIELTTVGFGMGNYNDELMERLADRGDGSYAYVDSLREARRIFVENLTGTLETVAADARIQVEFDPDVVARYRLLGYANRALPDEAFRDERVDAGEIGAGHRVSALYEIELARGASRSDALAVARLRWRSKESGRTEEMEEALRVRDGLGSWSAAPPSLRLAEVVAGFAERLGRSPHTGATLDALFREAQEVSADFPGRLDVARLVTEVGEARDLQVLAERR